MKIKRFFYFLIGIYGLALLCEQGVLLWLSDKSLKPSTYLTRARQNLPNPPVYLVSYADGHPVFYKNQNGQAVSAVNNGIDHIMMYKRRDIDNDFYEKNKEILDSKIGVGYWLWKSYFILKTMAHAPEGSVIVYADSPVIFKKPITDFLNFLVHHDVLVIRDGCLRKSASPRAGQRVKREALKLFNIDTPEFHKGESLWSCFLVVRNNDNGRKFVEQWLKNCQTKEAVMHEPFDPAYQHPDFIGHIYEQSMLTAAIFQRPDKVYVMDIDEVVKTIKNVHRHPKEEYKSLLPDTVSLFKISEWGYNSRWMQGLRKIFSSDTDS